MQKRRVDWSEEWRTTIVWARDIVHERIDGENV